MTGRHGALHLRAPLQARSIACATTTRSSDARASPMPELEATESNDLHVDLATVGKTTKLSLEVSDPLGVRDSDSLQFKCVAAAP